MKGCEIIMSVGFAVLSSACECAAIYFMFYGLTHEDKVVAWEQKMFRKAKRFLRNQLRKSDRIVAWAEKPTKHGRPDADFIEGQIKVYGDVWK